jgi:hypothetical protein
MIPTALLLIAALSGLPLVATVVGLVLTVVGVIVLIYMYTVSKIGQETTQLQDQANDAQAKIIDAMQIDITNLKAKVEAQDLTIDHLTMQNKLLNEQVTQAAKVDALRTSIEQHQRNIDETFRHIIEKMDLVLAK